MAEKETPDILRSEDLKSLAHNIPGVAAALKRALFSVPQHLEVELADWADFARRQFFKRFFKGASQRMRITPRVGLIDRFTAFLDRGANKNPGQIAMSITTYSQAARSHENPTKIVGVKGRLRIPLSGARNRGGLGRTRKRFRKATRDIPRTFPVERRGRRYIMQKSASGHLVTPLFVIQPSVKLDRAPLKYDETWASLAGNRAARLGVAAERALQSAAKTSKPKTKHFPVVAGKRRR